MSYDKKFARPQARGNKKLPHRGATFTGVVRSSGRGFAFIEPDDKEKFNKDFFVPAGELKGAFHGDRVVAVHLRGTEDRAAVERILSRCSDLITGTLSISRNKAVLYPDNDRYPRIYMPVAALKGAKDGYKVVGEITAYHNRKPPVGRVVEVLGEGGDLMSEELSIIRSFALEENFPNDVLAEAERVSKEKIVIGGRRDLRNELIITIDGADTRDIDDGVSIKRDGENYILGVHIADVSNYVKYKSALDKNAYSRGTSVYFPDRVLPMLPPALSNGACSLNPDEERYALSCFMTFDKSGKRLGYEICESVIKSSYRMTYTDVTATLNRSPYHLVEFGALLPVFEDMQSLCLALEKRRESAGSVDLDINEGKVNYFGGTVDGELIEEISVLPAERTVSERIIEQFMISANEAVAEFLTAKKQPCLYRVHQTPEPEKAASLLAFLKTLGVNAAFDTENIRPADFRKILKDGESSPASGVINKVLLRTMQKAKYSNENCGHFGLASSCYCHFTSPIRRYPDLFVHRVLKEILHGNDGGKYADIAEEAGADLSLREKIADEAERKVDDLYKLFYMAEHIGEEFDATISGVISFGVFCELENSVEGLIPLEDLPDESYIFYEEDYLLKGKTTAYKLGDYIRVGVAACDLGKLRVIFYDASEGNS